MLLGAGRGRPGRGRAARRGPALMVAALAGLLLVWWAGDLWAESDAQDPLYDPFAEETGAAALDPIADPLEKLNRAFFVFNDRLYFWVLKPTARGYSKVVPEPARVGIRHFFANLRMPVRAANCLLQGKFSGFGRELLRFFVNSTVGMLGFFDVAKIAWDMDGADEDLGQSLGRAGLGPVCYINWPLLGPSSLRDTVGMVGDGFLSPFYYLVNPAEADAGLRGFEVLNDTSLRIGDYESLKKAALDPYIAFRDAYHQRRSTKIRE